MNLTDYFIENGNMYPDKLAIVDKKERCTFLQLKEKSLKLAALMQNKGIRRGDYVLVLQNISIELYSTLIALWSLGAAALVFDPSAGKEHIRQCCKMIKPKGFIGSDKAHLLGLYIKEIGDIEIKLSTGIGIFCKSISESVNLREIKAIDLEPETPALITFTSGSTGKPKAAVRTHQFLLKQYETLAASLEYNSNQVDLATLPIFTIANLAAGLTTVIPDADLRKVAEIEPAKIVKQIIKEKISRVSASPAFMKRMADYCDKNKITIKEMEKIYTGGGPVYPRFMPILERVFPNAKIVMVYGSTEAEPIAEINWKELTQRDIESCKSGGGLPAGVPVSAVKCKIIKEQWGKPIGKLTYREFSEMECRTEEVGEIVVSGEHVLNGYFNGAGDEENKFTVESSRWHRTGDTGYIDSRGHVWLMGRAAACIKDDRGTLYPFSIESAVVEIFGINIPAVVSINNKRVLVIEERYAVDVEDIKRELPWAEIDYLFKIKKMPVDKRHNAKIEYQKLNAIVNKKLKK